MALQPATHNSPRFGAGLPLTPFQWRERRKDVLLSVDVDHTLLGWANDDDLELDQTLLDNTRQTLKNHRHKMGIHLNTGRSLRAMQAIAPFLKNFPIDYLSTNNGQELFINRRKNRDAATWIANLKPSDQARSSQQKLKRSGWNTPKAMALLTQVFQEAGFTPNTTPVQNTQYDNALRVERIIDGQRVTIEYYNDQPGFYLHPNVSTNNGKSTIGSTLLKQWQERLKQADLHGNVVNFYSGTHDETNESAFAMYLIFPDNITKATPVEDLTKKRLPNLEGVITAGDSASNDYDLLSPITYAKHLKNYPIVSGQTSSLAQKMAKHPRILTTPTACLAPAIERHYQSITQAGQRLNLSA